nr:septum formation initiator family protein [Bifidobacterium mongoliense]
MGKTTSGGNTATGRRRSGGGPVAFFIALFIVALGAIQLVSTFHTYALSLAELNGLKRQESVLIERKRELENDISRWDDKSYVTAQARDRLGFVFPGEVAVRVEHPEAVTGQEHVNDKAESQGSTHSPLPWYSELSYAFAKADQPVKSGAAAKGTTSSGAASSSKQHAQQPDRHDTNGSKTGDTKQ